jgi:site-specific recombinase
MPKPWDLTSLLTAADPRAEQAERHLWLVRLMQWLRRAPLAPAAPEALGEAEAGRTPLPVLRLRHLLNVLDRHEDLRGRVQGLLQAFWREVDAPALFADLGFGNRISLGGEVLQRLQRRALPGTPDTRDLAALFGLLFRARDAEWVEAIDAATLQRAAALLAPPQHRTVLLDAITILVSAIHSSGYSSGLRQRMDRRFLDSAPFRQLVRSADTLRSAVLDGREADALREALYLRTVLATCRQAADSVTAHLEEFGVSVDIVYELDQLQGRTTRVEGLLGCLLAPDDAAAHREGRHLLVQLLHVQGEATGLRALLRQHYSMLARQVAERSAETGSHYITRDRAEYRTMLRRAAGGGLVIVGTTWLKFAIAALGLSAFWTGFWSGANYAISFVIVMLLHWTVATKQPAMTAPALAATLPSSGEASAQQIEDFVDRVAQLIRSQVAAVIGNVAVCAPLVLALALLARWGLGRPLLVDQTQAEYVLSSLSLLGPTVLFAAFTGVLLFASSLVAGWAENWFVFHRLDSAIAWNPRFVARLGPARAQRWAGWWRRNVSGLAANISLGMMLGLVPALLGFIGLGLEVRHVTLASGQLGAALGTLGFEAVLTAGFWWCVAGIVATGVLNISVSFYLAFKVALRSRGVRLKDRSRIGVALRRRLRTQPMSFLRPPADGASASATA